MPVPTTIADLTTNEATNYPADSDFVTPTTRPSDYIRAHAAIIKTLESTVATNLTNGLATKQDADATLTALTGVLTAANKIPYATALNTAGELDFSTNTSLGTSDTTLSSQKAVKTYIDAQVATSVADSDFTGSNQSLGTNGYQKLPGGLIFQYGRVGTDVSGSNSAASSGTVTYPIAFPTAVLYVGFTPHEPDVAGATQGLTSSLSLTQFGYSLFGATGAASAADGLHWFAVGY